MTLHLLLFASHHYWNPWLLVATPQASLRYAASQECSFVQRSVMKFTQQFHGRSAHPLLMRCCKLQALRQCNQQPASRVAVREVQLYDTKALNMQKEGIEKRHVSLQKEHPKAWLRSTIRVHAAIGSACKRTHTLSSISTLLPSTCPNAPSTASAPHQSTAMCHASVAVIPSPHHCRSRTAFVLTVPHTTRGTATYPWLAFTVPHTEAQQCICGFIPAPPTTVDLTPSIN